MSDIEERFQVGTDDESTAESKFPCRLASASHRPACEACDLALVVEATQHELDSLERRFQRLQQQMDLFAVRLDWSEKAPD